MSLVPHTRQIAALVVWMMSVFLFAFDAVGQTRVNVALPSGQPPLILDSSSKTGLVYDVFDALNAMQHDYLFATDHYPAERLLNNFSAMDVHIIAYSDADWGWGDEGARSSIDLTNGRDLFFTLKGYERQGNGPEEIAAVRGFHYAFADFDSEKLRQMPNVTVVSDEESVVRLVENKRVEKGVVSEAFLQWISISKPDLYRKLDVDYDQPDHHYNRALLVLPNSPIDVGQIDQLLGRLIEAGTLGAIYSNYGAKVPVSSDQSGGGKFDHQRYFSSLM